MPANMMSAPVGSRLAVAGSSNATVRAGPTPGSTPTSVPRVTPMNPSSRFCRLNATVKPDINALKVSMSESREQTERQGQSERAGKEKKSGGRKQCADGDITPQPAAAEAACDQRKEEGRGQDEVGPADGNHMQDHA